MPKEKRLGLKRTAKEWEISLAEHIGKAFDKTPDVFMALFSGHPAVLGMCVMAGCSVGILAADIFGRDPEGKLEDWADYTKHHLSGLYDGSQKLVTAIAAIPLVTGSLGLITSVLAARKEGK